MMKQQKRCFCMLQVAVILLLIPFSAFTANPLPDNGNDDKRGPGNPEIVIQPTSFTVVIRPDTVLKFQMTVFNQGNDTLGFAINTSPGLGLTEGSLRNVTGSAVTSDKNSYLPGGSSDFALSLYNGSPDNEWLDTLVIIFPQGVTLNYATHFTGGTLGPLVFNGVTGNGVTSNWNDQNGSGGNILPGETAQGLINLSFDESLDDTLAIVYRIYGDNYGGNPHYVQDTLWLAPENIWLIAEPETGTVPPGGQKTVDLYFNSGGFPIGYFTRHFQIETNDTSNLVTDVPVNITVYPYSLTQTINIPAGWSGISTYVLPFNPDIGQMFDTVSDRVTVIRNQEGVYWPEMQINTIGVWNAYEGYVIRTTEPIQIKVTGLFDASQTVYLTTGWNLLPVLSTVPVSTFFVFRDIEDFIDVVHEVEGSKIYWPAQHIYTLTQLVPGKSYFIRVTEPCYVIYPSTE